MTHPATTHAPLTGETGKTPPAPTPHLDPKGKLPDSTRELDQLLELVGQLEAPPPAEPVAPEPMPAAEQQRLLQIRLGMASSLFTALRYRHAATAAHSLRVALSCSHWATAMEISEPHRDRLEVAALLHDVGKIGVPDATLFKPGPLTADEASVMQRHRAIGVEILRNCCVEESVLEIVSEGSSWYDGSRGASRRSGERLPLGARMLAIADAFDSMTSDHLHRKAMTPQRAFDELWRFSGLQFDPRLVDHFCRTHECDRLQLERRVTQRWLLRLDPEATNAFWRLQPLGEPNPFLGRRPLFEHRLLENLRDAVAFIDLGLQIVFWNRAAERLTGISAEGVHQRRWVPELVGLADRHGRPISDDDCPIRNAIVSGQPSVQRYLVRGRDGSPHAVDGHVQPVISNDGIVHGVNLVLHDASTQTSLEELCSNLHQMATCDPLTGLANRAEFDRVFKQFVAVHLKRRCPCSLIVSDLDSFKQINDTFGHLAGDEVLKTFAGVLKSECRAGDLVARYGGEEFVLLCADCEGANAVRRAHELRARLAAMPQAALDGQAVTASFGVTEIQPGDTPSTMFRRADRALFQAKDQGRNRVVQLGSGGEAESETADDPRHEPLVEGVLFRERWTVFGPLEFVLSKLRGFVLDHQADVVAVEANRVLVNVDLEAGGAKRRGDRRVPFAVELRFGDLRRSARQRSRKNVELELLVRLRSRRIRRAGDTTEPTRRLVASLKAYLMAGSPDPPTGPVQRSDRAGQPTLEGPASRSP